MFLDVDPEEAHRRLRVRLHHFMPASLIDSQFDTLERPGVDETDVITVRPLADPIRTAADAADRIAALGTSAGSAIRRGPE